MFYTPSHNQVHSGDVSDEETLQLILGMNSVSQLKPDR